jgi:hypothetical protein
VFDNGFDGERHGFEESAKVHDARLHMPPTICCPMRSQLLAVLDAAFEELHLLAVFIGGDAHDLQVELDWDELERLEEELDALEGSVMAKFVETKVESDRAWKALCAAHAMVRTE